MHIVIKIIKNILTEVIIIFAQIVTEVINMFSNIVTLINQKTINSIVNKLSATK